MPVTTFALLFLSAIAAAGLTIWAISAWGLWTVLPLVLVVALTARWAMKSVHFDDTHA